MFYGFLWEISLCLENIATCLLLNPSQWPSLLDVAELRLESPVVLRKATDGSECLPHEAIALSCL